jgi:hypothetical protein
MKYFKVGFKVSESIYSINIITANTGREEMEAATETAQRHATRHGYEVAFVKEVPEFEVTEALRRGMPMYPIDDEAEQAHDPSFQE